MRKSLEERVSHLEGRLALEVMYRNEMQSALDMNYLRFKNMASWKKPDEDAEVIMKLINYRKVTDEEWERIKEFNKRNNTDNKK